MTYKFALDAGTYEVVTGFYDPWAQWAGDDRHTKITVADEAGTELAVHEDHKISGSKDSVTLEKYHTFRSRQCDCELKSAEKKWTATSTAVMCW